MGGQESVTRYGNSRRGAGVCRCGMSTPIPLFLGQSKLQGKGSVCVLFSRCKAPEGHYIT